MENKKINPEVLKARIEELKKMNKPVATMVAKAWEQMLNIKSKEA